MNNLLNFTLHVPLTSVLLSPLLHLWKRPTAMSPVFISLLKAANEISSLASHLKDLETFRRHFSHKGFTIAMAYSSWMERAAFLQLGCTFYLCPQASLPHCLPPSAMRGGHRHHEVTARRGTTGTFLVTDLPPTNPNSWTNYLFY